VTWDGLPEEVRQAAGRCLVDLAGVAAGGFGLPQAAIVRAHVLARGGPGEVPVWFTGRSLPAADAAWANATAIESLDAHDGHSLTKGHAGVALLPGLLALYASRPGASGSDFLASLVTGYELAIRLGLALHASAPDYHSSGSWNAVAVAIAGAAALGGRGAVLEHAAGVAEYFAPRGPMMRCIARPTMVKDSSGWGCRVGVEAAQLALDGFTGGPSELLAGPVRGAGTDAGLTAAVAGLWADLGQRWRITEQYLKPYPVCRWAHPAVAAVLALQQEHAIQAADIAQVTIGSFAEAVSLTVTRPADTEQAQYSLPFAVAAALHAGLLGPAQLSDNALRDPAVQALTDRVVLAEVPAHSARFPAVRRADAVIELRDGRRFEARNVGARGDPDEPLEEREIDAKFTALASPLLRAAGAQRLRAALAAFLRDPARAGAADLARALGEQ
jgi:2-methylcitrate dehydratase PrpD